MASRLNLFFATAFAAVAYYFVFGLHPVWWLAWIAPLPLLILAPRTSARLTFALAFIAMAIAGLSMWSYHHHLFFPLWLSLLCLAEPALVFAFAVLFYRGFFTRNRPWLAALAFPAVFGSCEYLFSLFNGTFGNTAYTQMRDLPVLQFASIAGIWGIAFIVQLAPAMAAAAITSAGRTRRNIAAAFAIILISIVSFGVIRLCTTPPAESTVRVGLAESSTPAHIMPGPDTAMQLMQGYADQSRALASRGAQIVVLPEMTAVITDAISPQVDALFQQTARAAHVQILLGILHVTPATNYNEGRLYGEDGRIAVIYRKHHLVPGAEARSTPGTSLAVLQQPIGHVGVQICRDLDYPELARRYGHLDVGLLLAPAWEFGPDLLWHGHMALMRAVEDGFTLVRAAKEGYLTASDDRGRILGEVTTSPDRDFTTMLITVPVRHDATLYQLFGDWFAWLTLATLVILIVIYSFPRKQSAV